MKEYVLGILKDHKGDPSSSRVLAFLIFFALMGLMWFGIKSDPKQHTVVLKMAEILGWLIVACVGAGQGASAVSAYANPTATPSTTTAMATSVSPPATVPAPGVPVPAPSAMAPTTTATPSPIPPQPPPLPPQKTETL